MEQHQDARIDCGDCGASFLFSAAEAALFAERGLAAPKRCKDCRRARKDRGGADRTNAGRPAPTGADAQGNVRARFDGGAGHQERGSFGGRPTHPSAVRYTGDVNEYRSPMQTASYGGATWNNIALLPSRARPRNPRAPRDDGNYRAPSGPTPRARPDGGARPAGGGSPRPTSELFPITCHGCGADSTVPFKPAPGREVYCQACYRARKLA
jgi:CxxC-x17-CxxC domain-containing protein